MSRTDAHAPFAVRVARREVDVRAVHRCAGSDCDLPSRDTSWMTGRTGSCYWGFTFTGTNVCSCWMCHWHHRPAVNRAAVRTELRGVVRQWNGGCADAGS